MKERHEILLVIPHIKQERVDLPPPAGVTTLPGGMAPPAEWQEWCVEWSTGGACRCVRVPSPHPMPWIAAPGSSQAPPTPSHHLPVPPDVGALPQSLSHYPPLYRLVKAHRLPSTSSLLVDVAAGWKGGGEGGERKDLGEGGWGLASIRRDWTRTRMDAAREEAGGQPCNFSGRDPSMSLDGFKALWSRRGILCRVHGSGSGARLDIADPSSWLFG